MNPAGTVDTQNITISYNTATNQLSETGTGMSNNGICRASGSWSTNYGSLADFVDEVSVIPSVDTQNRPLMDT
jgi:beta-lactamase class A